VANAGHTGHRWRTLVATLKASGQPCAICTEPIDLSLKWPHPRSFSVDYYHVPYSQGGPMDLHNCKPTHLCCNQKKSASRAQNVTSREW
jgi:hypothetical protein